MTSLAFYRAEQAYLTPRDPVELDEPANPVKPECWGHPDFDEASAPADVEECSWKRCAQCDQPVCEQHATSDDAEPRDCADGQAHTSCHASACRDADCWYDG